MPTTRARSAGFTRAWIAKTSTAGIPTDIANLANDADNALTLSRLFAAQSADLSLPEDEVVSIEGDDGVDGQFNFESIELLNFQLTLGRNDFTTINLVQGTSNVDLQSTFDMALVQPLDRDFVDCFLLLTRRSQDDNSAGKYENWLIPNAVLSYRGSAFSTRQAASYSYSVTANRTTKTFYGATLSSSIGGKTAASAFIIYSDYPLAIDVWREDGTETDFVVGHTPRTGGNVLGWSWDESTAPTTKTVTYNTPVAGSWNITAGTSGDLVIILYELA